MRVCGTQAETNSTTIKEMKVTSSKTKQFDRKQTLSVLSAIVF